MIFGLILVTFCLPKRVQKSGRKKVRKKVAKQICGILLRLARRNVRCQGNLLGGVKKAKKCRSLEKDSWNGFLKVIIYQLSFWSSARSSLPYGQCGGALRAIRRARSRWPVKLAKYYP